MLKKVLAFLSALFLFFSVAFLPLRVWAVEPGDYAQEILQNYKSRGTDEYGNVILSEDDYESYMNDVLAYIEKNSAEVSDSQTLTKSQTRAVKASAPVKASFSSSDLILDEVKEKSRFLDLPIFNNFVVDAVKWMITECLSNPIYAGEELPEESESESETETESETEPTPPTTTTDTVSGIAGLASNLQKYTINGNDLYERVDISFSGKVAGVKEDSDASLTITRSGLGASSTYKLTYKYNPSASGAGVVINWNNGSYNQSTYGFPAGTMYAGYTFDVHYMTYEDDNDVVRTLYVHPKIYNFSVNQLPVISRSGSTTVTITSILDSSSAVFSENSFFSNNPTYISNHTINASTNNYWNSYNVSTTNTNSYITSNTTINTTNYNDYSQYGYYINDSGGLSIDDVALNNYIQNTLLAGILAGYVDFYTRFPEVGVNVTDTDITYVDPFEIDEQDPTETGSGSGTIQIDYDEILSEGELESILTQETYEIDTFPTFPIETIDEALPEKPSEPTLPASLQSTPDLLNIFTDIIADSGLESLYFPLGVFSVLCYCIRGHR